MRVIHTDNEHLMCDTVAQLLISQVILKPNSVLGLATGETMIGVYKKIIEEYNAKKHLLSFQNVRSVNLDEYVGLPRDHSQSYNYYMQENLFRWIDIQNGNYYLPEGSAGDLEAECQKYEQQIQSMGGIDLQLLGIGPNGHIGFNEPANHFTCNTHVTELTLSTQNANSRFFGEGETVPDRAVTMGMKTILNARKIVLAVNGAHKKEILERALYGPVTPAVPASALQLHPDVTVVEACG